MSDYESVTMMKYFTIKSQTFCILKFTSDIKIKKAEIHYKNLGDWAHFSG